MSGISINELFLARKVLENVLMRKVLENVLVRKVLENVLMRKVLENVLARKVLENVLARKVLKNVLYEKVLKNNLLLYIIKMTCSICHEINHNANDCSSPIIHNTFSTISNIFIKDVRSYADRIFIEHCPDVSNVPKELHTKLKSSCKTIPKSLWHRISYNIIDSIEINLPFFSSFKDDSVSHCIIYLFDKFKHANKFIRRASYKHFFLKLLKLLCRFYYNMDPQLYLNSQSSPTVLPHLRRRHSVVSLQPRPFGRPFGLPTRMQSNNRNNLFQPFRSTLLPRSAYLISSTPYNPLTTGTTHNIIHRATYHEDSLDTSLLDSLRNIDLDDSHIDNTILSEPITRIDSPINIAITESLRTLADEDSAREEFARTELKSRIQFQMHPLTTCFKNNSCSVCLEDINPQHSVALNCLHAYCTTCLDGIINQSKGTCPMCRDPITTVLFKPDILPDSFNSLARAIYT